MNLPCFMTISKQHFSNFMLNNFCFQNIQSSNFWHKELLGRKYGILLAVCSVPAIFHYSGEFYGYETVTVRPITRNELHEVF